MANILILKLIINFKKLKIFQIMILKKIYLLIV